MCDFVFDPSNWHKKTSWLKGPQKCPYPPIVGGRFCAFHMDPYISINLPREYLNHIYKATVEPVGRLEVICSTVPYLDFQELNDIIDLDIPINIGYSTFLNPVNLSSTDINADLSIVDCRLSGINLSGSKIFGDLNILDSTVQNLDCKNLEVIGDSNFENSTFSRAHFNNAIFNGSASFCAAEPEDASIEEVSRNVGENSAEFLHTPNFLGTKFENLAIFSGVEFHEGAVFSDAQFRMGTSFKRAKSRVGAHFGSVRFQGRVDFGEADLGFAGFPSAYFQDITLFENAKFGGLFPPYLADSISNHATAEGIEHGRGYIDACQNAMDNAFYSYLASQMEDFSAVFSGSRPDEYFYVEDVSATSAIDLRNLEFDYLSVSAEINRRRTDSVGLANASIERGEISVLDKKRSIYQLQNASLGDVRIHTPEEVEAFENLYIADTKFTQFDFSDYRGSLETCDWVIDGIDQGGEHTKFYKRETTYAKAKAGAARQGDTFAESNFFIMERRCRRERHVSEFKNSNTLQERISSGFEIFSNYLYDVLCEFGENPRRISLISILSIPSFSIIYWLLHSGHLGRGLHEQSISVESMIDYIIFSLQSFTSFFVPGGLEPANRIIHFVSSIQSFWGAFAIALFVATVVRTVQR